MTVPATPGTPAPTGPDLTTAPVQDGLAPQQAATPATPEQPATPPQAAPEAIGVEPPAPQPAGHTYPATGDVGLDLALQFFGERGLVPDHPAMVDAVEGKFDKLEAYLAAMGDTAKGYDNYLTLAKQAHQRNVATVQERQTQITAAVTEVAGDEATWTTIKDWAGKNATPDEKEAINAMLSAGPVQARAAALMLSSLYRDAAGTVVSPANPAAPTAGNSNPTNTGALSPAEYGEAVRELRARLGTRFDSSPEYQALQARRMAFRG